MGQPSTGRGFFNLLVDEFHPKVGDNTEWIGAGTAGIPARLVLVRQHEMVYSCRQVLSKPHWEVLAESGGFSQQSLQEGDSEKNR